MSWAEVGEQAEQAGSRWGETSTGGAWVHLLSHTVAVAQYDSDRRAKEQEEEKH